MTYNTPLASFTAPPKPTNGVATAALVLGILAAVGAFIPFVNILSMIIAVAAAVLGGVALGRARKVQVGVIRAWFGIILGLVTIPVALVITIATADVLAETETVPEVSASVDLEQPAPAPEPETEEPAEEPAEQSADEPAETVAQEQARISAESYLLMGGFSRTGLLEQLAYEGFTAADAEHAVASVSVDWREQAAISAASYVEMGGFSRAGLIDQLLYEGFSQDEAEYGVDQAGL
ncbi:Ltp family lipoprotein [Promicromonospora sp. NPDC023805]|uniref:Ltp family lipoprotein n=1 Tax=Promicromonospora sp. NPDC023805 TaxID=3154696 RepID=UPI0033DD7D9C